MTVYITSRDSKGRFERLLKHHVGGRGGGGEVHHVVLRRPLTYNFFYACVCVVFLFGLHRVKKKWLSLIMHRRFLKAVFNQGVTDFFSGQ